MEKYFDFSIHENQIRKTEHPKLRRYAKDAIKLVTKFPEKGSNKVMLDVVELSSILKVLLKAIRNQQLTDMREMTLLLSNLESF